jgi:hypothetical protein
MDLIHLTYLREEDPDPSISRTHNPSLDDSPTGTIPNELTSNQYHIFYVFGIGGYDKGLITTSSEKIQKRVQIALSI